MENNNLAIAQLSQKVQGLYLDMDQEVASFLQTSQLKCTAGCGECCANPEIEATMLEMLPLALFLIAEKKAEAVLDNLKNVNRAYCFFYQHEEGNIKKGQCTIYAYRPSLCRLFGVAKVGIRWSVCKEIKDKHALAYDDLLKINPDLTSMNDWTMRLFSLDAQLGQKKMPINEATKLILEKIILYESFQINY